MLWDSNEIFAALSTASDCFGLPVRRAIGVIKAWRAFTCSVASLARNLILVLCVFVCVCAVFCNVFCAAVSLRAKLFVPDIV